MRKTRKTTERKEEQASLGIPSGSEQVFRAMAARHVWWKTPEEALRYPQRIAAQVMNLGDWDNVKILARSVGDDFLRSVIRNAEAGQFDERSWATGTSGYAWLTSVECRLFRREK